MDPGRNSKLVEEMTRFEQEILGASAQAPKGPMPLFPPKPQFNSQSVVASAPPVLHQHKIAKAPSLQYSLMAPRQLMTHSTVPQHPMPLPMMVPQASQSAPRESHKRPADAPSAAVMDDIAAKQRKIMPKKKVDKKKLRMAGGKVWRDETLDDWDPNDFRIFCGDLGNDVNDDTLARAFSKYPSFQRAKVIRDKHSKKTKGYGFVSFKDPHDFIQAMREMNGRYIGSHPIKLRKSTWKDRNFESVKKKEKEKKKLGFK